METRRTVSGQRPGVEWVPVTRSVHRRRDVPAPATSTLRAWAQVLGEDAVFTHVTAALVMGLWLPRLPEAWESARHVVLQVPAASGPLRRRSARVLRSDAVLRPALRQGLPCASAPDVLLALARDLCDLDLLVAVDSALHAGLATPDEIATVAAVRRRGAPRLRRVLALADGRSESPWETVLREFHRHVDVAVTPQFEIRTASGRFVARGDLRLDGLRVIHEYDGHHHLEVGRQRSDLRRARRLEEAGWVRRGYAVPDLLERPHEMLADVDRSLGRVSDPERLRSWRAASGESALTGRGRRALAERLG